MNACIFFLYGADEFDIYTGHKALEVIYNKTSKPPARLERWQRRLQNYSFRVIHRSGSDNTSDYMSDNTSDYMSDNTSDYMSDNTSDYMSDNTSDYMSDNTSDYMSDNTSDYMSDNTSDYMSDNTSDYMSDNTSDYMSDNTSDYMSDNTSDYMSRHPTQHKSDQNTIAEEYVNFITSNAVPKAMTLEDSSWLVAIPWLVPILCEGEGEGPRLVPPKREFPLLIVRWKAEHTLSSRMQIHQSLTVLALLTSGEA